MASAPYPARGLTPWDDALKAYIEDAVAAAGGGGTGGGTGGPSAVRETVTVVTASLAAGAVASGTVDLGQGYRLLSVQADRACRIRLYDTPAARTADVAREIGTDPTGDHGLMFEYVFTAAGSAALSPVVDGFSAEDPPVDLIAHNITNMSASASPVTVTFLFVRTE